MPDSEAMEDVKAAKVVHDRFLSVINGFPTDVDERLSLGEGKILPRALAGATFEFFDILEAARLCKLSRGICKFVAQRRLSRPVELVLGRG